MTEVSALPGLLADCLHDLADGERQMSSRLPKIAEAVSDGELGSDFVRIAGESESFAPRLEARCTALDSGEFDAPNIWMRGILEDAKRDTEMIDAGPLLDIALIGAIRKALAATAVSLETAIGVSRSLEDDASMELLSDALTATRKGDARLADLLARLTSRTG